jgi:HPt (histidine-containing phosphotransfer) domain-containing protein
MNVNWTRIESFASLDDPEEVEWLKEMIASLIDNMRDRIADLDSLKTSNDTAKAQSVFHQIKGVAANFGLDEIQKIAAEAELKVKGGDLPSAIILSDKIAPLWELSKKELTDRFPI